MQNINVRKATLDDLNGVSVMFDQYRQFYDQTADLELAKKFIKSHLQKSTSVIFLASSHSDYINGETLHVNGGMYMA